MTQTPSEIQQHKRDGQIVDDRFCIESQIGSGGMCTVFKAQHLQLQKPIAIKILNKSAMVNQASVKRFQRESAAISKLQHPNIVQVFGCGVIDEQPYMAMEYLEGESLATRLKAKGALDKSSFTAIATQICDALQAAHNAGIVHRDLKPSNIMLLPDNTVKLVDFGIAKILPESGNEIQKLTQTGEIFGTILYMSPEQFMGTAAVDHRADIYSLGCIMYEMLTGHAANPAESPLEVLANHLQPNVHPDERLGEFTSLVFSCISPDPADRPANAGEVKNLLLNPQPIKTRKSPLNIANKFKLRPTNITLLCLLIATIFGTMWTMPHTDQNSSELPRDAKLILTRIRYNVNLPKPVVSVEDLLTLRSLAPDCPQGSSLYRDYQNVCQKAFCALGNQRQGMVYMKNYLSCAPDIDQFAYFSLLKSYTDANITWGEMKEAQGSLEDAYVWARNLGYQQKQRLISLELFRFYSATNQTDKFKNLAKEITSAQDGKQLDDDMMRDATMAIEKDALPVSVPVDIAKLYVSDSNPRKSPGAVKTAREILRQYPITHATAK